MSKRKIKTPLERVYIPMEWRDKHEIEWPVHDYNDNHERYILWRESIEKSLLSDIPSEFSILNMEIASQRIRYVLNYRYKNAKTLKGNIKDTYLWDNNIKHNVSMGIELTRQNCPKAFLSSVIYCCYP